MSIGGISSCAVGEREGTVNYTDCREIINLEPDTFQKYYKIFTCEYIRRASGKIVSGTCVHVDLSSTWFSSNDKCTIAYVYSFVKQDPGCTVEFPFLGYDGKCYRNWEIADKTVKVNPTIKEKIIEVEVRHDKVIFGGKEYPRNSDGTVVINGQKYKVKIE